MKAVFEITDETGNVIDSYTANAKPTWQKVFTKAGKYGVNVSVFDDMGAASSTADPTTLPSTSPRRDSSGWPKSAASLARGTYGILLRPRRHALGRGSRSDGHRLTMGPAIPSQGDPWKVFFMGNVTANLHLGQIRLRGRGIRIRRRAGNAEERHRPGQPVRRQHLQPLHIGQLDLRRGPDSSLTSDRPVGNHYKLLLGFRYIAEPRG